VRRVADRAVVQQCGELVPTVVPAAMMGQQHRDSRDYEAG